MRTWIIISLFMLAYSGLTAQTLDDYLAEAAENNPGLKGKYAEFEAAMQRSAQVAQMPNPTLSFGYFIQPIETRVGPQQAKIGLSQLFPWFGTLKSRSDVTAFIAEARYYAFVDAREALYREVKVAYFRFYENQRLAEIERENLALLQTLRELSLSRFENGKGSMADVYRADIAIDQSEITIEIMDEKFESLQTRFNSLLNREVTTSIVVTYQLETEPDSLELAPSDFSAHPSQRSISELQASARASELAATKAGFPSIGVGMDYVFVGERGDATLPDNGKDAFVPMVSVSLPIYRKGYRAARTEAQKMQEAYASRELDLENNLHTRWQEAHFELLEAQAMQALLERQIEKTQTVIALLTSEYSNDALEFEVLLREQQRLLEYRTKQVRASVDEHIARAALDYLLKESNERE